MAALVVWLAPAVGRAHGGASPPAPAPATAGARPSASPRRPAPTAGSRRIEDGEFELSAALGGWGQGHLDPATGLEASAADVVRVRTAAGDADDGRADLGAFGIGLYAFSFGPLSGVVGQLRGSRNGLLATQVRSVGPGTLRLVGALDLPGDAHVRLGFEAATSMDLAHATASELAELERWNGRVRLCLTQAEVSLRLDLEVGDALRFTASYRAHGDPFHFGRGTGCLGNPPVWLEGRLLDLEARIALASGLTLRFVVGSERYLLAYDVRPSAGEPLHVGTLRARRASAMVILEATI